MTQSAALATDLEGRLPYWVIVDVGDEAGMSGLAGTGRPKTELDTGLPAFSPSLSQVEQPRRSGPRRVGAVQTIRHGSVIESRFYAPAPATASAGERDDEYAPSGRARNDEVTSSATPIQLKEVVNMSKSPWPTVSPKTLADQAYHAIRDRIVNGQLGAGQFVREQEVSEALGVSRTPVREALGRLASEGFLERIPHRGFQIPDQPVSTLLELYPILSALELLAGRLALRTLDSGDVERLKGINSRMLHQKQAGTVHELIQLNERFHHVICRRSGNRRLLDLLADLRSQVRRLEMWYYSSEDRIEESIAHHDQLIRAIEQRDHTAVLDLLRANMALTYERFSEEHLPDESEPAGHDQSRDTAAAS